MSFPRSETSTVVIRPKLMPNYRQAAPVTGDKGIVTALDAEGRLQVFAVGTNGAVYNVAQDSASDTGWSLTNLQFPAAAKLLAAGTERDGTLVLFGCDADDKLYSIRDVLWQGGWHYFASAGAQVAQHVGAIQMIRLANDKDGNLLVSVCAGATDFRHLVLWSIDHAQIDAAWTQLVGQMGNIQQDYDYQLGLDRTSVATPAANGVSIYQAVRELTALGAMSLYWIRSAPWPMGTPTYWTPVYDGPWVDVALAPDPRDPRDTVVFAIKGSDPSPYQISRDPNGDEALRMARLDHQFKLTSLVASANPRGLLEVFAITADGHLFHIRQDPARPSGWADGLVVVREPAIAQISVTRDRDGVSHVFGVTTASPPQLCHIWQDEQTSDWQTETLEVQTGDIERYESYTTHILVLDPAGAPRPYVALQLTSDDPVALEIDGAVVTIDAESPWEGVANASGEVSVSVVTTTLGAPVLKLRIDFMPDRDRIEVNLAGRVQDRLHRIHKAGLLDAKVTADDGGQASLLQGENRGDDVAGALANAANAAMSLLAKPPPSHGAGFVHSRTPAGVARYVADHDGFNPNRIHLPSVAEQYWHIDFSSGIPTFRSLSGTNAAALLDGRRATLPTLRGVLDVDWGDIWEAVKEGVGKVVTDIKDVVVATVIDPVTKLVTEITAQISVFIEGATYLWEGTLDFVQQAFDVVEAVLAKIQVGFDALFRWLGEIFVWPDIVRTKDAIRHSIEQTFDVLTAMVRYIQTNSDTFFTTMQAQVDTAFDEFIANDLGGQSFLVVGQSGEGHRTEAMDDSMAGNIVLTAFLNNVATSPPPSTARAQALAAAASDGVSDVLARLTQYADQFQTGDDFQRAVTYFSQVGDQLQTNPDAALRLTIAGVLQVIRPLARGAIGVVRLIVYDILEALVQLLAAIKALLEDPWPISFLQAFYKSITGAELSAMDLVALMVAIPASAFYKATHTAPDGSPLALFRDQAAVDQFNAAFTAQWMLAASRIGDGSAPATSGQHLAVPGDVPSIIVGACDFFNIFGTVFYGIFSAASDIQPYSEIDQAPTPVELGISAAAILCESLAWITSIPWLRSGERPWFGTATETANAAWLFLYNRHGVRRAVFRCTATGCKAVRQAQEPLRDCWSGRDDDHWRGLPRTLRLRDPCAAPGRQLQPVRRDCESAAPAGAVL